MLNIVSQSNQKWNNPYLLLKAIQLDINSVDVFQHFNGEVKRVPKSIAFRNMSEIGFTKLFNNIVDFIIAHLDLLLPGMSEDKFKMYVQRVLDFV